MPTRLLAASLGLALCVATAHAQDHMGDPARDREAILAMQGEYQVDFAFDETVLLAPGYERAPAQRSGGDEVVIVVEDAPGRIVLQHILVDARSGHVTKHWRQDWTYEASQRWEFAADQTWRMRPIPADRTPAPGPSACTRSAMRRATAAPAAGTTATESPPGPPTAAGDRCRAAHTLEGMTTTR